MWLRGLFLWLIRRFSWKRPTSQLLVHFCTNMAWTYTYAATHITTSGFTQVSKQRSSVAQNNILFRKVVNSKLNARMKRCIPWFNLHGLFASLTLGQLTERTDLNGISLIPWTSIHFLLLNRAPQPCSQGLSSSFPSVAPREGKKGDPVNEDAHTLDQVARFIFLLASDILNLTRCKREEFFPDVTV